MSDLDPTRSEGQIFVLNMSLVETGDVILTSERQLRSKAIRAATWSEFSHAMICVGHSCYVHAVGSGVEIANPQRQGFDHQDRVLVLRYNGANREVIALQAANFARKKVGTEYSVPEAIATKLRLTRKNLTNRQFCSRLVAQAYSHAGVDLVADPDYCSPRDLASSKSLSKVAGCVIPADETAIALISEGNEALDDQAAIISSLVKVAREISGLDIQTLDQLEDHLLESASNDSLLTEALRSSGYLQIWKTDVEKNPWRYDAEVLLEMGLPVNEIRACAERELTLSEEDILRFFQAAEHRKSLLQKASRQYFSEELALFEHLVRLHTTRKLAAIRVLIALN